MLKVPEASYCMGTLLEAIESKKLQKKDTLNYTRSIYLFNRLGNHANLNTLNDEYVVDRELFENIKSFETLKRETNKFIKQLN